MDYSIEIDRIIGHVKGVKPGPTVIFTAGIHGNEPSGIFALKKVLEQLLKTKAITIKGTIYAISGNLYALERGKRYEKSDLNRLWTKDRMHQLQQLKPGTYDEDTAQQVEIFNVFQTILKTEQGPFYFMDLHTTSSESIPFLTVNDSLLNRWFTSQYPLPIVLGIEEYIDGPILSYINELGYVSFGFEAGQHDELSSYENQEAFIYLSLVFAGCLDKTQVDYQHFHNILAKTSPDSQGIFEIYYQYRIKEGEDFKMEPGFVNFRRVRKGQLLANSNGHSLQSTKSGRIFMPLYQTQGNDGFYMIRRTKRIFMTVSEWLRSFRFDKILPVLPGVRWVGENQDTLQVDLTIARFFARQFFHLLGYRAKVKDRTHLIVKNREDAARNDEYQHTSWFKK